MSQSKVVRNVADLSVDGSKRRGGLSVATPIPVPQGWTNVGAIQPGDRVIGADGSSIVVTSKSEVTNSPAYRITMSDGTDVVCDGAQEWTVGVVKNVGIDRLTVTADRLASIHVELGLKGRNQSLIIQNGAPIDGPSVLLTLNPYILGAWLGDGTAKSGEICVGRDDFDEALEAMSMRWPGEFDVRSKAGKAHQVTLRSMRPKACDGGHSPAGFVIHFGYWRCQACQVDVQGTARPGPRGEDGLCSASHPESLGKKTCQPCWRLAYGWPQLEQGPGLIDVLRDIGLLRNKMVPQPYLRASREQRLELLRGLADTDGHWHPERKRVVFVNTNQDIADGFAELARSLGVTVQRHYAKALNERCKRAYMVEFRPVGFNPFSIQRKAVSVDAYLSTATSKAGIHALRRYVTGVEVMACVHTQGIGVAASDGRFLAGVGYIPTHGH